MQPELIWFDEDMIESEYDLDPYEIISQAEELAKGEFNILRHMNLSAFLYDHENNKVAGALWLPDEDEDEFSFDIVVSPEYRGQKLSISLIDAAMGAYKQVNDYYVEVEGMEKPFVVDAINPIVAKVLQQKYGFTVAHDLGGGRKMLTLHDLQEYEDDE